MIAQARRRRAKQPYEISISRPFEVDCYVAEGTPHCGIPGREVFYDRKNRFAGEVTVTTIGLDAQGFTIEKQRLEEIAHSICGDTIMVSCEDIACNIAHEVRREFARLGHYGFLCAVHVRFGAVNVHWTNEDHRPVMLWNATLGAWQQSPPWTHVDFEPVHLSVAEVDAEIDNEMYEP